MPGAHHPASSYFGFGAAADEDYYPTTGAGASEHTGNSPIATSSDLRDTRLCSLDALVLIANTDGAIWTIKDAAGVTITTITVAAGALAPDTYPLGMHIQGVGGFTVATDDVNTFGVCLYTPLLPVLT